MPAKTAPIQRHGREGMGAGKTPLLKTLGPKWRPNLSLVLSVFAPLGDSVACFVCGGVGCGEPPDPVLARPRRRRQGPAKTAPVHAPCLRPGGRPAAASSVGPNPSTTPTPARGRNPRAPNQARGNERPQAQLPATSIECHRTFSICGLPTNHHGSRSRSGLESTPGLPFSVGMGWSLCLPLLPWTSL